MTFSIIPMTSDSSLYNSPIILNSKNDIGTSPFNQSPLETMYHYPTKPKSAQNQCLQNIKNFAQCDRLRQKIQSHKIRSDYVDYECRNLIRERSAAKEELKRIQSVPLAVGNFGEMIDENHAVVHGNSGQSYYVRVLSTLRRDALKPNTPVAFHRHSISVVKVLEPHVDVAVSAAAMTAKPTVTFRDIGGLDSQKRELREAVELPLTHAELFRSVGVEPPRGVLLYGPPGTGKTMMAKAVANSSDVSFINVVGSEFVQKYIGEGARMVRNVFQMARESAKNGRGAIIFIDEIDAIAMARHDSSVSSDREVQRILLELLNQMDGFDQTTNIKVIMATNRPDTLDPALMRPGRLDRKIEFPLPDRRQRRMVYYTVTNEMSLSPDLDLESFVRRPEKISSADITAICAEAGLRAIRANRYMVNTEDFDGAYESVVKRADKGHDFYK